VELKSNEVVALITGLHTQIMYNINLRSCTYEYSNIILVNYTSYRTCTVHSIQCIFYKYTSYSINTCTVHSTFYKYTSYSACTVHVMYSYINTCTVHSTIVYSRGRQPLGHGPNLGQWPIIFGPFRVIIFALNLDH
jgi:hypothetical protein